MYIADRSNHRVVKSDLQNDGAIVASIGSGMGPHDGRFKYPQGVAFARTTAHGAVVFVSDYGNDRVAVLDADDLSWKHAIREAGRLALPAGLAVSATELFVVDASEHVVRVYDIDEVSNSARARGELRTLGGRGTDPGELDYPWGLAVDVHSRRLYVGEGGASGGRNGRVQVLCTASGESLQVVTLPDDARVSGLCAEGERVLAIDHHARVIRVLTSAWGRPSDDACELSPDEGPADVESQRNPAAGDMAAAARAISVLNIS